MRALSEVEDQQCHLGEYAWRVEAQAMRTKSSSNLVQRELSDDSTLDELRRQESKSSWEILDSGSSDPESGTLLRRIGSLRRYH